MAKELGHYQTLVSAVALAVLRRLGREQRQQRLWEKAASLKALGSVASYLENGLF